VSCIVFQTVKRVGISKIVLSQLVDDILKQTKQQHAEISIHLIADTYMKRLNKMYGGRHGTTDVLTFVAQEGFTIANHFEDLGDIFVSIPQIRRQAKLFNLSFREELYRMIIHGVLHAEGYDHKKKQDAKIMFLLQERLLKQHIMHSHPFV